MSEFPTTQKRFICITEATDSLKPFHDNDSDWEGLIDQRIPIITRFYDELKSYQEVSLDADGLHILVKGDQLALRG